MAEEANIQGWRQADFAITKIKKLRFLAQKSKKSHAKDDKEKHLEKIWKPHQKLLNFVAKKIKRVKETITEIKKNWEVPKESDRKNNTLFGTSSEKLTPVEVKKMYSGPICQDTKSNIMRYNLQPLNYYYYNTPLLE